METNTNKKRIIETVWNNPGVIMRGEWKPGRKSWAYIRGVDGWKKSGAVRLLSTNTGENITVLFNHDSDRPGQKLDIFTYIQERDGLSGFPETLQRIAAAYGLPYELTKAERERIQNTELARIAAASLIAALKENPNGETARYIRNVRRLSIDGQYFGELTAASIQRVKQALKNAGKSWTDDQLKQLGLTTERAAAGYNMVMPYYHNGNITGLIYRNIRPGVADADKYRYQSGEFGRAGYCFRIESGQPVVIVEGQLDAIRLIEIGVNNVLAFGGSVPGEEIGRLLRGRGINTVVYVPDNQNDETGKRKPDNIRIINDVIQALQSFRDNNGEPLLTGVGIADLPQPTGPNAKNDAASYGADNAAELLQLIDNAPIVWGWELEQLREWAEAQPKTTATTAAVQERAADIYRRTTNVFQRQQIQTYIKENAEFEQYGVTADALRESDEWRKQKEYTNKVKQYSAELNKAVESGTNPETVGAIVRRLAEAQGTNTRAEWDRQLLEPFGDELAEIADQPETLKTDWILYKLKRDGGQYKETAPQTIEFYPADIAVFCAPTSHGKTMVLFQSALKLLNQEQGKTFLFISCEESKRQLTERALNVYLDIPTTDTGKDTNGQPCFLRGTRKKTIKAVIRAAMTGEAPAVPESYLYTYKTRPDLYKSELEAVTEHFNRLAERIKEGVQRYGDEIRPRLKFIHTEASAESICNNILHTVEEYRAQGIDVGAVFVDYMQLLTTDARNYSRHDELKDICKALKDCAARTELPVIIAAQLNREVLRLQGTNTGLDNITVANIGEGADVERIAHDIYLIWQVDKTPRQWYAAPASGDEPATAYNDYNPDNKKISAGIRSNAIFTHDNPRALKEGYLYIEQMKARDGITGGWGLFPFDGERGKISANDINAMKQ